MRSSANSERCPELNPYAVDSCILKQAMTFRCHSDHKLKVRLNVHRERVRTARDTWSVSSKRFFNWNLFCFAVITSLMTRGQMTQAMLRTTADHGQSWKPKLFLRHYGMPVVRWTGLSRNWIVRVEIILWNYCFFKSDNWEPVSTDQMSTQISTLPLSLKSSDHTDIYTSTITDIKWPHRCLR
jgi:hypothetical protein